MSNSENPVLLTLGYLDRFDSYCQTYFQLNSLSTDLEDGLCVDYEKMAELVDTLSNCKEQCLCYKKQLGGEEKLLPLHADYSYEGIVISNGKLQSKNVVHIANRLVKFHRSFNFFEFELGTLVKYLLLESTNDSTN